MDPLIPCLLGQWLLTDDDRDDQLAVAAQMYKGMARCDAGTYKTVQAETDWFILQLIHCSDLKYDP